MKTIPHFEITGLDDKLSGLVSFLIETFVDKIVVNGRKTLAFFIIFDQLFGLGVFIWYMHAKIKYSCNKFPVQPFLSAGARQ